MFTMKKYARMDGYDERQRICIQNNTEYIVYEF